MQPLCSGTSIGWKRRRLWNGRRAAGPILVLLDPPAPATAPTAALQFSPFMSPTRPERRSRRRPGRRAAAYYLKEQNQDGSWGYCPHMEGTGSMTCSAMAGLTVIRDVAAGRRSGPRGQRRSPRTGPPLDGPTLLGEGQSAGADIQPFPLLLSARACPIWPLLAPLLRGRIRLVEGRGGSGPRKPEGRRVLESNGRRGGPACRGDEPGLAVSGRAPAV